MNKRTLLIAAVMAGILSGAKSWAGESRLSLTINPSATSGSNSSTFAHEPANSLAPHFLPPASSARPWVWWWWPGCAVTKPDITANLEAMARSGIGGVNIIGILDVKEEGVKRLPYLSPEWTEHLVWAVREARRLGMDADTSPVPGWAFGGAWVKPEESAALFEARSWQTGVIKIPFKRLVGNPKDPAPGKSKSLQLTCSINGQEQTFTGTDAADIEINAQPEQVRVTKALYGAFPDGPTLDLTAAATRLPGRSGSILQMVALMAPEFQSTHAMRLANATKSRPSACGATAQTGSSKVRVSTVPVAGWKECSLPSVRSTQSKHSWTESQTGPSPCSAGSSTASRASPDVISAGYWPGPG